jgi:hypothetical protein
MDFLQSPMVAIPLFTAIVVLIVASPVIFKLTNDTIATPLRLRFASPAGVPTRAGLLVHSGVAFLLMYAYLKSYAPSTSSLYTSI